MICGGCVRLPGDGFDLDQQIGEKQSGDLHERARRRRGQVDELVADGPDNHQIRDADHEERQLDDVGPARAAGAERATDVLEGQPCLRFPAIG
jgi:hypothetical protein